jgi:Ran GTPase-activating protein (RanGAP) involved in mRNA processing and transport
MNQSLTFLELSYNALGVSGGIALGDALQDNKVLRHLLVANNSLDSVATMVICAGILENANLEYVCFDENPIGQQGAMVLMVRSPPPPTASAAASATVCVCLCLSVY